MIYTSGNVFCLFIFIRRNLDLKKIYKELITSLLVWDLVFIILGKELFSNKWQIRRLRVRRVKSLESLTKLEGLHARIFLLTDYVFWVAYSHIIKMDQQSQRKLGFGN